MDRRHRVKNVVRSSPIRAWYSLGRQLATLKCNTRYIVGMKTALIDCFSRTVCSVVRVGYDTSGDDFCCLFPSLPYIRTVGTYVRMCFMDNQASVVVICRNMAWNSGHYKFLALFRERRAGQQHHIKVADSFVESVVASSVDTKCFSFLEMHKPAVYSFSNFNEDLFLS